MGVHNKRLTASLYTLITAMAYEQMDILSMDYKKAFLKSIDNISICSYAIIVISKSGIPSPASIGTVTKFLFKKSGHHSISKVWT